LSCCTAGAVYRGPGKFPFKQRRVPFGRLQRDGRLPLPAPSKSIPPTNVQSGLSRGPSLSLRFFLVLDGSIALSPRDKILETLTLTPGLTHSSTGRAVTNYHHLLRGR